MFNTVFFLLVFKQRAFSSSSSSFGGAQYHRQHHQLLVQKIINFKTRLDKNVQNDAYTKYDELSETPSKRTPQSTPRDTHKQRRDDDVEWQLYDAHSSAFGNVRVVVLV